MANTTISDKIFSLLKLATTAPSGDNSQPWQVKINKERLDIFCIPNRDNPILNVHNSGTLIALGAFIENIAIAAPALGLRFQTDFLQKQDSTHIASFLFSECESKEQSTLFSHIKKRHTNRRPYSRPPAKETLLGLQKLAQDPTFQDHLEIRFLESIDANLLAGEAASSIEQVILEDKKLHNLFFKDIRWTSREAAHRGTGLWVKTMEFNPIQKLLFRFASKWERMKLLNKIGFGKFIAKQDAQLYGSGGFIGAIILKTTPSHHEWLNLGRLLQRVWLQVTTKTLSLQPIGAITFAHRNIQSQNPHPFSDSHHKIIEHGMKNLNNLFQTSTQETIGIIFRLGHSQPPSAHTPRQSLSKILLS